MKVLKTCCLRPVWATVAENKVKREMHKAWSIILASISGQGIIRHKSVCKSQREHYH
jgi:hypothetical protein